MKLTYKIQTPSVRLTSKLGDLVDYYYDLREEKRYLNRFIDDINAKLKRTEEAMFAKMKRQGVTSGKATHAQGSIVKRTVFSVEDWDEFFQFAKRKGNEDLFQKSCSSTAIREREEDGIKVPGIKKFTKVSISVTKLR